MDRSRTQVTAMIQNDNEMNNQMDDENIVVRHHRKPQKERDAFFVIRQILNVLFMVGAVAGCIVYLKVDDRMGAILIIIAMAFKMAECVLRFKK